MKNSKSKRILFVMFFPVVFVLIMLTIGLPQQLLTAATVGTEKFKVTDFNFYYYEAYYSFVNENYNQLGDLGLNIDKKLKSQQYDAEHSWRDHFRDEALDDMQEYQILNAEADKAGFDASDEVESVRAEKAETIRNACISANITDENKYLAKLYDGGMTEKIFYKQLASRTRAEAYRDVVLEKLAPSAADAEEFAQNYAGAEEYQTADVVVTMVKPATDRSSGETEERQWENAETYAKAIQTRAEQNGGGLEAYTALASRYSNLNDTDHPDGHFAALTKDDVEDTLEAWCFDPARQSGDNAVLRDETGVYLVYFNGFGETNLVAQAREQLLQERYEQWLEDHKAGHEVSTGSFGMLIAG